MSGSQGFKTVYATLGPVGSAATVAGAIAVVVLGASLWSFGRAALTTAPSPNSDNSVGGKSEAQDAAFKNYLAQIDGRSLFLVPGAPVKEPEVVVDETPKGPPPPPPVPTEYGGSSIIAIVLDTVWFDDGRKMKVGDPVKDDTEVVAVNAPWDADLKWKGERFTVPLFGRDKVVLKREPGSSSGAVKTSMGSSTKPTPTSTAGESDARSAGAGIESGGAPAVGSGAGASPAAAEDAIAGKSEDTSGKPVGEKVVGPANSPSQEAEHPQVVVPKPAPGEKPVPPPGGIPPPPPPPDAPRN